MILQMQDWVIRPSDKPFLGYEGENDVSTITIICDDLGDWTYYLKLTDEETSESHHALMTKDTIRSMLSLTVTQAMIGEAGQKYIQIEGRTSDDALIKQSNVIRATAGRSLQSGTEFDGYTPSEADQILSTISGYEQRCTEAAGLASEKEAKIREYLSDAYRGSLYINDDGYLVQIKEEF